MPDSKAVETLSESAYAYWLDDAGQVRMAGWLEPPALIRNLHKHDDLYRFEASDDGGQRWEMLKSDERPKTTT